MSVGGTVTGPKPYYDFYDGTLSTPASIDVAAHQQTYVNMASSLAALSATGTANHKHGGQYMAGDGTGNTQVFNLDGSTLLGSHTFGLDTTGFTADTTIIFNVSGKTAGLTNMGLKVLQPFASNVLFNFYEATELVLKGIGVWGSILAPLADLHNPRGVINGTLIANSFDGPMQLNYQPFEGNVPHSAPRQHRPSGYRPAGLLGWRKRR